MVNTEKVLVIRRGVLEKLGLFQGVSFEVDSYLQKLWGQEGLEFIFRSDAEQNTEYKQLIPYVIMACGDSYLCYIRGKKADEPRLLEKASIGIGGHINPSDDISLPGHDFRAAYFNAVTREVAEEVIVESAHDEKIVALINDDSNNVGQVHFGIIHFWKLNEPKVRKREQMISKLQFMSASELYQIKDAMESWSQLCLENLDVLAKKAGS